MAGHLFACRGHESSVKEHTYHPLPRQQFAVDSEERDVQYA